MISYFRLNKILIGVFVIFYLFLLGFEIDSLFNSHQKQIDYTEQKELNINNAITAKEAMNTIVRDEEIDLSNNVNETDIASSQTSTSTLVQNIKLSEKLNSNLSYSADNFNLFSETYIGVDVKNSPIINHADQQINLASHKLVKVIQVVDGDTIKVSADGLVETVRIIGIDTPETVHPNKPVECFGLEASDQTKKLLNKGYVYLFKDETQGERDKYGRKLAYVILADGRDLAEEMIIAGYGYEYTYNLPYINQSKYQLAQNFARENSLGLWAEGVCDDYARVKSVNLENLNSTDVNNDCLIKGNINSKGEKIYHMLGQQYYHKTVIDEAKNERWFCTEEEAVLAGWRKSRV